MPDSFIHKFEPAAGQSEVPRQGEQKFYGELVVLPWRLRVAVNIAVQYKHVYYIYIYISVYLVLHQLSSISINLSNILYHMTSHASWPSEPVPPTLLSILLQRLCMLDVVFRADHYRPEIGWGLKRAMKWHPENQLDLGYGQVMARLWPVWQSHIGSGKNHFVIIRTWHWQLCLLNYYTSVCPRSLVNFFTVFLHEKRIMWYEIYQKLANHSSRFTLYHT